MSKNLCHHNDFISRSLSGEITTLGCCNNIILAEIDVLILFQTLYPAPLFSYETLSFSLSCNCLKLSEDIGCPSSKPFMIIIVDSNL